MSTESERNRFHELGTLYSGSERGTGRTADLLQPRQSGEFWSKRAHFPEQVAEALEQLVKEKGLRVFLNGGEAGLRYATGGNIDRPRGITRFIPTDRFEKASCTEERLARALETTGRAQHLIGLLEQQGLDSAAGDLRILIEEYLCMQASLNLEEVSRVAHQSGQQDPELLVQGVDIAWIHEFFKQKLTGGRDEIILSSKPVSQGFSKQLVAGVEKKHRAHGAEGVTIEVTERLVLTEGVYFVTDTLFKATAYAATQKEDLASMCSRVSGVQATNLNTAATSELVTNRQYYQWEPSSYFTQTRIKMVRTKDRVARPKIETAVEQGEATDVEFVEALFMILWKTIEYGAVPPSSDQWRAKIAEFAVPATLKGFESAALADSNALSWEWTQRMLIVDRRLKTCIGQLFSALLHDPFEAIALSLTPADFDLLDADIKAKLEARGITTPLGIMGLLIGDQKPRGWGHKESLNKTMRDLTGVPDDEKLVRGIEAFRHLIHAEYHIRNESAIYGGIFSLFEYFAVVMRETEKNEGGSWINHCVGIMSLEASRIEKLIGKIAAETVTVVDDQIVYRPIDGSRLGTVRFAAFDNLMSMVSGYEGLPLVKQLLTSYKILKSGETNPDADALRNRVRVKFGEPPLPSEEDETVESTAPESPPEGETGSCSLESITAGLIAILQAINTQTRRQPRAVVAVPAE